MGEPTEADDDYDANTTDSNETDDANTTEDETEDDDETETDTSTTVEEVEIPEDITCGELRDIIMANLEEEGLAPDDDGAEEGEGDTVPSSSGAFKTRHVSVFFLVFFVYFFKC